MTKSLLLWQFLHLFAVCGDCNSEFGAKGFNTSQSWKRLPEAILTRNAACFFMSHGDQLRRFDAELCLPSSERKSGALVIIDEGADSRLRNNCPATCGRRLLYLYLACMVVPNNAGNRLMTCVQP
jgi:hypothetical protein